MEILITNDDGYNSKGIAVLARLMQQLGHVTIVAPDGPRSCMSNAITMTKRMSFRHIEHTDNRDVYITNGTPADCVKLAANLLYKDRLPDLLVSGINHGSNASVNVIYSGTVGACLVGTEHNIPSIGFSLNDHSADADFSEFEKFILPITRDLLSRGFEPEICYNVNAPVGKILGYRFARHAHARWINEIAEFADEAGEPYYMMQGEFVNLEPEATDTDEYVMANSMIAICPTTTDLTAYNTLSKLNAK